MRHPLVLGALGTAALLAAGCGSSKKSTATTPAASAPTQSASAPAQSTPAATGGAAAGAVTVATKQNKVGTILAAGPKRRTVYLFEADKGSASSCTGACAKVWPAVTTGTAATASGSARSAQLGTITRPDGSKQVTYAGHPLYYYAPDGDRSDTYGQGIKSFGAGWYVLAPSGSKIDKS